MRNINKKKKAAIICAVVIIAGLGLYLAVDLFLLSGEGFNAPAAAGLLLIYGAVIFAVIIGVIIALRQRLKELDDGEEEEAKKY